MATQEEAEMLATVEDAADAALELGAELQRVKMENHRLREILQDVIDELEEHHDIRDGEDGEPRPNWAMQLTTGIELDLMRLR
jgi:regulator of replication initiation timing